MRLALGTVQFGLNYGIANVSGQVRRDEVIKILEAASEIGIDTLDTAVAYGESEQVLGEIGVDSFNIISKIPAIEGIGSSVYDWVRTQVGASLRRLNIKRLHAVLLHRPDDLLGSYGAALLSALYDIKAEGLVSKIGISVYSPEEIERLLGLARFDLIQAPMNILDQRMIESGWAKRLNELGIELHIRSAFLQGLLLMTPDQRPAKFDRWSEIWQIWQHFLQETGHTPLEACMRYPLFFPEVDRVVVGVNSAEQLYEIAAASIGNLSAMPAWNTPVSNVLINPSLWSQI